eukprot:Opistho-2@67491
MQRDAEGDEKTRRNRNSDNVVKRRPREIPAYPRDCLLAEINRHWHVAEVVADKHNVRSLHGNVSAAANRNADISLCECGRVVYAITHHSDNFPGLLQLPHVVCLLPRKHFGIHSVNAHSVRNRRRRAFVVARHHRNADAHRFERTHRGRCRGLGHVHDSDNSNDSAINRAEQTRLPLALERRQLLVSLLRNHTPIAFHPRAIAGKYYRRAHAAAYTAPRDSLKVLCRDGELHTGVSESSQAGAGKSSHRDADWMFAALFRRANNLEKAAAKSIQRLCAFLCRTLERIIWDYFAANTDGDSHSIFCKESAFRDLRLPGRERPRLVKHNHRHSVRPLQWLAALDEYAVFGTNPCTNHHSGRCCEAKSARARNYKHRNCK